MKVAIVVLALMSLTACHKDPGEKSSGLPLVSPLADTTVPQVQTSTTVVVNPNHGW